MENKNNCLICGEELIYNTKLEKMKCHYCNREFESNARCRNGHYICDGCHSMSAYDIIAKYCETSSSKNPIEMALDLMNHPSVKMHGPEHHFLIPAVLISAYFNVKGDTTKKCEKIIEAGKRAKNVLGGFCGFYGSCGAGVGTGIFISIITDATPLSTKEWQLSNLVTAEALKEIALNGGPRCCKRNTLIALKEAINFARENLDVSMTIREDINCSFSKLNMQCRKSDCKFFEA